jgi:hypothetical protein
MTAGGKKPFRWRAMTGNLPNILIRVFCLCAISCCFLAVDLDFCTAQQNDSSVENEIDTKNETMENQLWKPSVWITKVESKAMPNEKQSTVCGAVYYLQRIALPPDAKIEFKLVDISKQDMPAVTIAVPACVWRFNAGRNSYRPSFRWPRPVRPHLACDRLFIEAHRVGPAHRSQRSWSARA